MLSGESDMASVAIAMTAGADKFMEKPTPFKELKEYL
jgi:FixJ family two-component response regulator